MKSKQTLFPIQINQPEACQLLQLQTLQKVAVLLNMQQIIIPRHALWSLVLAQKHVPCTSEQAAPPSAMVWLIAAFINASCHPLPLCTPLLGPLIHRKPPA